VVELKDHLDLLWVLLVAVVAIAGVSALLAATQGFAWTPPVVVVGVVTTVLLEGAFAEWKDADDEAKSFNIGQSLELTVAKPVKTGGRIHTPLRVHNPNDEPMPDCYVRVVSCQASGDRDEYGGPREGYHYPWSTYEGEGMGTIASIGRRSSAILDFAFAVGDNVKCCVPHLNKATGKIDAHFYLLRGKHKFVLEVGSKSARIAPSAYRVVLNFGGGLDLEIETAEPIGYVEAAQPA